MLDEKERRGKKGTYYKQDFRNLPEDKFGDNEIEAVIDWERALVGHNEYDLFKAKRDFIDLKFKTENIREKYRGYLLNGYREIRELEIMQQVQKLWTIPTKC